MKVSELTGTLLNYWAAKADDLNPVLHRVGKTPSGGEVYIEHVSCKGSALYSPSTDCSQGGPIIERERIMLIPHWLNGTWRAYIRGTGQEGESALIAAMRCYIVSKFGEEVPDETV